MDQSSPVHKQRVDPNAISLKRYRMMLVFFVHCLDKRRQQKFNKNSNIISKYRNQKEKLYREVNHDQ